MVKKVLYISLGALLLLVVVVAFLWFFLSQNTPGVLLLSDYSKTNSNNHIGNENRLDINGDYVATRKTNLLISHIIVQGKEGTKRTVYGDINWFMLDNGHLYYTENDTLHRLSVDSENSNVVAEDVCDFYVCDDRLVYNTFSSNELFFQDLSSGSKKKITDWNYRFWVNGDIVYYGGKQEKELLFYSLADGTFGSLKVPYNIDTWGGKLYFQKDKLVRYDEVTDSINVFDLNTLDSKEISLFGEPIPDLNHINIAVNDEYMFLSFERRNSSGSVVWNAPDSEKDGLWCINLENGEKVRVSEKTFDSLFATDSHLFGITSLQQLYSVDLKTFAITKE